MQRPRATVPRGTPPPPPPWHPGQPRLRSGAGASGAGARCAGCRDSVGRWEGAACQRSGQPAASPMPVWCCPLLPRPASAAAPTCDAAQLRLQPVNVALELAADLGWIAAHHAAQLQAHAAEHAGQDGAARSQVVGGGSGAHAALDERLVDAAVAEALHRRVLQQRCHRRCRRRPRGRRRASAAEGQCGRSTGLEAGQGSVGRALRAQSSLPAKQLTC